MLLVRQRATPVASTSAIPYSRTPAPQPGPPAVSSSAVLIVNGAVRQVEKSGGRLKKYFCAYEGCDKSYTRPVRLEEHMRTHTGERPFKCSTCDSTFLRDSHLKAHVRTHQSDEDKTLACDECDKKFWTSQHLRKHVEVVHRGKTYDCSECGESFKKHNLLRTHVAEAHSPPGTNPFRCEHPGCDKSFKQNVHLKSHMKIHDPSRYLCGHPDCLHLPLASRQFPNWSALGKHTKSEHPPACPHPECKGRTFASSRGLKGHLQLHAEGADESVLLGKRRRSKKAKALGHGTARAENGDASDQLVAQDNDGDEEQNSDWEQRQDEARDDRMQADFSKGGKKKRRVMARLDTETPWPCSDCSKRFKSSSALDSHVEKAHPTDWPEDLPPLPALPSTTYAEDDDVLDLAPTSPSRREHRSVAVAPLLDLITGAHYQPSALATAPNLKRQLRCPVRAILYQDTASSSAPAGLADSERARTAVDGDVSQCDFWFSRIYDVERHLRSHHQVKLSREQLEEWYRT